MFETGNCKVTAQLEKNERMLILNVEVKGTIELTCDRSLEKFDYPIGVQEQLFYNYSIEGEEVSDDDDDNIFYISSTTERINISHPIYELIGLQIPMRKIHPKYEDEEDFFYSSDFEEDNDDFEAEENIENDEGSLEDKLKNLQNRFNK